MAIVQSVSFSEFREAFRVHDRGDQFSPNALRGLFDYLEEYSEATGKDEELDVIALCCDFTELSFSDAAQDYSIDVSECADDEEMRETVLDYLNNRSLVVWHDDETVLFQVF